MSYELTAGDRVLLFSVGTVAGLGFVMATADFADVVTLWGLSLVPACIVGAYRRGVLHGMAKPTGALAFIALFNPGVLGHCLTIWVIAAVLCAVVHACRHG